MPAASLPDHEDRRIASLLQLQILDTPAEAEFDALVEAAAEITGTPISLISLIDTHRQWFKANTGLDGVAQTPRELAFCAHAILDDQILEITDAHKDARFSDNELVTGAPHIRFYAGAPLTLADGSRVGTLCVIDHQPRQLSATQRRLLSLLARAAEQLLQGRQALLNERDLRAHASQSAALMQGSFDAILGVANNGRITHCNEAALRLTGHTASSLVGALLSDLLPELGQAHQRSLAACLSGTLEGTLLDTELARADGLRIPTSVSLTPVAQAPRPPGGLVAVVRDMRQHQANLQALAGSEARFRALSEISPLGIFATSLSGDCTYTNERWQDIYGMTLEQSLGDGWASALHPEDRDAVWHLWQSKATHSQELDTEFRVVRPDNTVRQVRARARSTAALGPGLPAGYVGTVEDVTAQRQTERALAHERDRLRQLYEATPAMLHSIDAQGRLLSVSAQWLQTLGYAEPEVIGRAVRDFLTPASLAASVPLLQDFFQTGIAKEIPCQMVCKGGQVIDVLLSAVLVRDSDGNPLRSLSVVQDVTDKLKAERALQEERWRLASIIDSTGTGTWEWNAQTDELRINANAALILGYPPSELEPLAGQFRWSAAHPHDAKSTRRRLQSHLRGETPHYEGEVRLRHRDGHWVWTEQRGRVITRTDDGRPQWVYGLVADITPRKQQELALRKSQELLHRTGEVAGVGGWEVDLATGELTWSEQTRRIHGVPDHFKPQLATAIHFYAPEGRPLIEQAVTEAIRTGQGWDLELPFIRQTGERIWVRAVGQAEFDNGQPVRLVGAFQDVTRLHELTAELTEQHELMRVTLQSIGDAVITTNPRGEVTWLNPVAERMTGWLHAEAHGKAIARVFHIEQEDTRQPAENPIMLCLEQRRVCGLAAGTVLISRDGREMAIEDSAAPICNEAGELLGAVLVFHDVTEQRRLSGEMTYRATHDALTGLCNRTELETQLARLVLHPQASDTSHALMFIDLDQFKIVNDTCGHSAGDLLLQQVSRLLAESVRARDTVARLGGDEFAVLLERCPADQAHRVAQKICDRMEEYRFLHDERRFRVGASIGLVALQGQWSTPSAALQAADAACYAAKEGGRNRVHLWVDDDQGSLARRGNAQWATRLAQALDEDRFVLFAQRICPAQSDPYAPEGRETAVHAEVLVRLKDPDGTLVSPGLFIPAAERFHLASRLNRWVLRTTIATLQALPNLDLVNTLSVNLSGQSIGDRAFHRQAVDKLTAAGPQICARLCLEITETAAITNLADASAFIEQVRALGVRIALDDFGAGASSFSYLKNLHVDILKIDGHFIRDLIDDPLDDVAVRCFVDLARVLEIKTVAEYVHNASVLERVQTIGIHYAQGYHLHQPEPLSQVLGVQGVHPQPPATSAVARPGTHPTRPSTTAN